MLLFLNDEDQCKLEECISFHYPICLPSLIENLNCAVNASESVKEVFIYNKDVKKFRIDLNERLRHSYVVDKLNSVVIHRIGSLIYDGIHDIHPNIVDEVSLGDILLAINWLYRHEHLLCSFIYQNTASLLQKIISNGLLIEIYDIIFVMRHTFFRLFH